MRTLTTLLALCLCAATAVADSATTLTWWGHASFVVRTANAVIAVDPWLDNPKAPKGAPWPDKLDAILLTHGHSDHVGNAVALAKKTGATVFGSYELVSALGLDPTKISPANPGGTFSIKDVVIHVTPAVHSSSLDGKYAGAPVGYVIQIPGGPALYHAGDTDAFGDMAQIAERYHPTVALLPIGGRFTMDADGAALAARLLKVGAVVPMHYGTMPMLPGTLPAFRTAMAPLPSVKILDLVIGTPTKL